VSWLEKIFRRPAAPPLLVRFHHPARPRPRDLEKIVLSARFSPSNAVLEQHIFLAQGVGVMPPFGRAEETEFVARFEDGAHAAFRVRPAEAQSGLVHEVTLQF